MMKVADDTLAMSMAIGLAHIAVKRGMRPFGCIIVDGDRTVIGTAYGSESSFDPTRHSEMLAIRDACKRYGAPLNGCSIYSTHEPCPMCCGAINHSKLSTVVFGSYRCDLPELFTCRSLGWNERLSDTTHPPLVVGGCMRDTCVSLFAHELTVRETTIADGIGTIELPPAA